MDLLTQILFTSLPFVMTIIILYLRSLYPPRQATAVVPEATEAPKAAAPKEKKPTKAKSHAPTHPLFTTSIKGFLSAVVDFDVKAEVLAACSAVSPM